jgi:hypothetical protein
MISDVNAGMPNVAPMSGDLKALCRRYMNYHVIARTADGQPFEAIIDGMDDEGVTMLIPEEVDGDDRQFPYGRRRFRRFRRQRFPFSFLFPFVIPYPYYYPPYPYSPPYYPGYGYGGYGVY